MMFEVLVVVAFIALVLATRLWSVEKMMSLWKGYVVVYVVVWWVVAGAVVGGGIRVMRVIVRAIVGMRYVTYSGWEVGFVVLGAIVGIVVGVSGLIVVAADPKRWADELLSDGALIECELCGALVRDDCLAKHFQEVHPGAVVE